MSDSEDSEEGISDSELVGNTEWCECDVCVSLSESECTSICWQESDILEESVEVEDVACVT